MLEIDISADLTSEQKQRVSTIVYWASHAAASLVDHLPYPEGQFSANSELSSNEDSQKMTSKNLLYSLVLIVVGIISGVFFG